MTTIDAKYPQPSSVRVASFSGSTVLDWQEVLNIHPGQTLTLKPVWSSSYSGFQVQFRTRKRKAYAAGLLEDASGAEVWTEYEDWATPSGATANAAITDTIMRYATGLSTTVSYDITTYDLTEVETRVRVYDSAADKAGEWGYGTTIVAPVPTLSSCTATTDAEGYLSVTLDDDWPRYSYVQLFGGYDYRGSKKVSTGDQMALVCGQTTRIPPSRLVSSGTLAGALWCQEAWIVTGDGAGIYHVEGEAGGCALIADSTNGGFSIKPGTHVDPQDVPTPTATITTTASGSVVMSISCQCSYVRARAEYDDAEGVHHAVDLKVTGGTSSWTATLDYPPYGSTVTVKAACCNSSGGYKLVSKTETVTSTSHCHLDGDGDHVELKYDGELQQSTEVSGESVQTAGRKLPVSRHGANVSRSLTVKGTIAFPSVLSFGDMELSALKVLDNPHDWIYRDPKGTRKTVRVTSWNTSQSTDQLGRVAEVTISMEEVS